MTDPEAPLLPTIDAVRSAAAAIAPYVHLTPLLASAALSAVAGVEIRLKCENLQRAGSFKIRGAMNALSRLSPEEKRRGVVAFSSGNHAQGVALAAKLLGMKATIVMPEGSVASKVEATKGYGATVVQAGVTEATRGDTAAQIAADTGAVIIPPFDHPDVIAGAGTAALEIVQEWPDVRTIVAPLGGGGLLAGTALAATSLDPSIAVFGVEPAAGNDGEQSFRAGSIVRIDPPRTIADGAKTTAIGVGNFAIIRQRVRDIVSVDDSVLLDALQFAMYRTKLVIEPTGALGIAAILSGRIRSDGPVAIIVSGGNIDWKVLGA